MIEGVDAKNNSLNDKQLKAQFGENLFALRKKKGLTRKQLAEILNVSEVSVGSYERGLRQPNFEMLFRIASFFEVSLDNLLGYSDVALNISVKKYRLGNAIKLLSTIGAIYADKENDTYAIQVYNLEGKFQTDEKGIVKRVDGKDTMAFGGANDLIYFVENVQREATFSNKTFKVAFYEIAEKLFADNKSIEKGREILRQNFNFLTE